MMHTYLKILLDRSKVFNGYFMLLSVKCFVQIMLRDYLLQQDSPIICLLQAF